ncbi:MAG: hypothetical protein IBX69_02840 [Anaerolineales bacterium]|nr:hypothetical protein [Anaerolineales bacterium]
MLKYILGAFFILHGLVHLLYFGQSHRLFELRPGMAWPDGSWILSKLLGDDTTRLIASISLVLAALGFFVSGSGFLFQQPWWRPLVVGISIFSSAAYIILWDGKLQNFADKGFVAILINLAILVALLVFNWPEFES